MAIIDKKMDLEKSESKIKKGAKFVLAAFAAGAIGFFGAKAVEKILDKQDKGRLI